MILLPPIGDRIRHAWDAFMDRDSPPFKSINVGSSSSIRPDRPRFTKGAERTIVTAIYNKIAMDCASVDIRHVKLDENNRYISDIDSSLNSCLNVEANIDQTGRAFKQDIFMSMFDEGCVAVVPVETDLNPKNTDSYKIFSMRTGKVVEWFPEYVKVNMYNDKKGLMEDVILPKKMVAIIENPLYSVMNERNSVMQRLIRKLSLLDAIDEQAGSGKLNLIIQLPYVVKTEARKAQANARRKEMEDQLANSKYGIAYTDGTEKITQLGRGIDNNLMAQIEYLTKLLYSQMGITQAIMEGTASEQEMLNYNYRTIEPIISALVDEMKRKFLTKTARTQKQSIMFFRDPFRLCPISNLSEIADKFTRNEIMSTNEFRQIIGMKPSMDPAADELRNKNMPISETGTELESPVGEQVDFSQNQNALEGFDNIDKKLDDLERSL